MFCVHVCVHVCNFIHHDYIMCRVFFFPIGFSLNISPCLFLKTRVGCHANQLITGLPVNHLEIFFLFLSLVMLAEPSLICKKLRQNQSIENVV